MGNEKNPLLQNLVPVFPLCPFVPAGTEASSRVETIVVTFGFDFELVAVEAVCQLRMGHAAKKNKRTFEPSQPLEQYMRLKRSHHSYLRTNELFG